MCYPCACGMLNLHSGEVATECTISRYIKQKKGGKKKSFFTIRLQGGKINLRVLFVGGSFTLLLCSCTGFVIDIVIFWGHELKSHSSRLLCVIGCCSTVRGEGCLTTAGSWCALMKCSPIADLILLLFHRAIPMASRAVSHSH